MCFKYVLKIMITTSREHINKKKKRKERDLHVHCD